MTNLLVKNMVQTVKYEICLHQDEDSDHLFFKCSFAEVFSESTFSGSAFGKPAQGRFQGRRRGSRWMIAS
jgi:hypothetical protein